MHKIPNIIMVYLVKHISNNSYFTLKFILRKNIRLAFGIIEGGMQMFLFNLFFLSKTKFYSYLDFLTITTVNCKI